MGALKGKAEPSREFSLDVSENCIFVKVLSILIGNSGHGCYGITRDELKRRSVLEWEHIAKALKELAENNLLTAKEKQIGTAGISDIFYELVPCQVELTIKVLPQKDPK